MRRKMTTLKCKSGGVQNGNGAGHPRALLDEAQYRENINRAHWEQSKINLGHAPPYQPFWDPHFSGLSNPSRPRDYAVFLRPILPIFEPT